jgi:hypothetical protein
VGSAMGNYALMSGPGIAVFALLFLVLPMVLISVGSRGATRTPPGTTRRIVSRVASFTGIALLLFVPLVLIYNFVILRWLHNL